MRRQRLWAAGLGLVAVLVTLPPAWAVITRLTPLRDVLAENKFICVAQVERLEPQRPGAVLTVEDDLKGKFPYRKLPINLTGDKEAKKDDHTAKLLKRLPLKGSVILFGNQRGKRLTVFGYTNGTWFQMIGQKAEGDEPIVWAFTHCEPYLRRTFKGTTAELRQAIADGLAGKKLPEPNEKEPPGFGPEAKEGAKKSEASRGREPPEDCYAPGSPGQGRPLFAVIPTVAAAPLLILAALFPSVFGGVILLFRQWLAFFTVISITSLLCMLHGWFAADLVGSWWGTPGALWLAVTVVLLGGTLWAWWRHARSETGTPPLPEAPQTTEFLVLGLLSVSCLGVIAFYALFAPPGPFEAWWNLLLVLTLGLCAATLARAAHLLVAHYGEASRRARRPARVVRPFAAERAVALALAGPTGSAHFTRLSQQPAVPVLVNGDAPPTVRPVEKKALRLRVPTEGVILWVALVACVAFAAARPGARAADPADDTVGEERTGAKLVAGRNWLKVLEGNGNGLVMSSPLIADGRAYVAAARGALDRFGALYCLDVHTQLVLWTFDNDGDMKQVFSSPCLAGGRIYIGEGFHEDKGCRLYCLDAATGKKVWEFATSSHTEGSPVVAGGRVYFSAGDDGVYCVGATKGAKIWQFPDGERKKTLRLHVDMTPALAGKKLYIGGGIDEETGEGDGVIACLDADTGKELWVRPTPKGMARQDDPQKKPLSLPVWGSPVADGGQVFFGLGNGRMTESSKVYTPAGALLCVDATTGKELWPPFETGDGVLNRPALDRSRVYFGSRDGFCYCLDRRTGKLRWKKALGSPVVASPALDHCPHCRHTSAVYALGIKGQVVCLDPYTGKEQWELVTLTPAGDRRQIYFGVTLNDFTIPALYCLEDLAPER